jgi:aspartyl protease family protein
MAPPRSGFAAPPQGGNISGPAKPDPRCPLDQVTARRRWRVLAALCISLSCGASLAQSVTLAGSIGDKKALLIIDGQPQTVGIGQSVSGVTLVRMIDGQAQVQFGGTTTLLRIGGAPARLSGTQHAPSAAREIVMAAGLGGHFTSAGAINGKPVKFMVDTGATLVALSQAEAERIGLDFRSAQRGMTQTANGAIPVHLVTLSALRVGEVEVNNVPAVVLPAQMPYVLLGNSFLSRFQMRRDNDVMRLEQRQ